MPKRGFNFPDVHRVEKKGNTIIKTDINMKRFERQFERAQFKLDSMVMTHMEPYMPMVTHTFINTTKKMSAAIAGTGYVYAAAPPFGRFLYEGKTMVSPTTGSTFALPGEKKVLVSEYSGKTRAKEDLEFNRQFNTQAQPKWFEAAKKVHGKNWVSMTKKLAGGG